MTGGPTPPPRGHSSGRSSAGPTSGPRPRGGSLVPLTPERKGVCGVFGNRVRWVSGDDVADQLGRALLWVEGGGPLGQLPQLAPQLLELGNARIQVGGV